MHLFLLLSLCTLILCEDEGVKDFLRWLDDEKFKHPKITVENFGEEYGNGIKATEDVNRDDLLIEAPMKRVICKETILKMFPVDKKNKLSGLEDEDVISMFLMRETARKNASLWYDYLKILPEHVPIGIYFNDEELDALQNEERKTSIKKEKSSYEKKFLTFKLKNILSIFFNDIPELVDQYATIDRYYWAISIICSRALTIEGKRYLVPLADVFNYNSDLRVRIANDGENYGKYHQIRDDKFIVYADRYTQFETQAFEDYGDMTNALYIDYHGFVPINNPFDCVKMKYPDLQKDDNPDYSGQLLLLTELGLAGYQEMCVRSSEVLRKTLQIYMLSLTMTSEAAKECVKMKREIGKGQFTHDVKYKCFFAETSQANHYEANQMLMQYLQKKIDEYPTTIEKDFELLKDEKLSINMKLAIQYRISQKRTLKESCKILQTSLHPYQEKYQQVNYPLEVKLKRFNEWFNSHNPKINNLEVSTIPGMRIGAITTRDVNENDIYLTVPNEIIMDYLVARNSTIGPVLDTIEHDYNYHDHTTDLTFFLIYEKFINPHSKWRPYLDILPQPDELEFPLYYTDDQLKEIKETLIYTPIFNYKQEIMLRFQDFQELIFSVYPQYFPPDVYTWENYKWATAILDSRSIWWDNERHLVPMLDTINCGQNPLPEGRVHTTKFNYRTKVAETKAAWNFKKGEQLLEDYGQPNYIYFEYHGFTLDINNHNCLYVQLNANPKDPLYRKKSEKIRKLGLDPRGHSFCISDTAMSDDFLFYFSIINDLEYSKEDHKFYVALDEYLRSYQRAYRLNIEDEKRLLEITSDEVMKRIIKYRIDEKTLMKDTLDFIKYKIDHTEPEL